MRKLVSTHLFRRQRLQPGHLETLQRCGVEAIELFCARTSFDYRNRTQVEDIAAWINGHGLELHSIHSPIYADAWDGKTGEPALSLADREPRRRLEAMDEAQRALEICERTPARFLVQHLGPSRLEWDARASDCALTSLERLRLLCKQAGVGLLVENIPNGLSTPEKLIEFLTANHLDDVGVCFDSGHAHLATGLFGGGGAEASWELLQPRVRSTHLHDNHGQKDEHLWPGQGTVDWARLLPRMRAAAPELPLLLEVGDLPETADVAASLRQALQQLEAWAG